ncbi:MAG: hypothetical protein JWR15_4252 [Prosthecobacter sp.]|nr:hypothetical protein [Prosthecobacter sp.]
MGCHTPMSFLRSLFGLGPFYHQTWQELSHELGAVYDGEWPHPPTIRITRGFFVITLSVQSVRGLLNRYPTPYTRLRAIYRDRSGLRFTLEKRGLRTAVAEWFGVQNLKVDHPEFDARFVLKGTDRHALKHLFDSAALRALVEGQHEPVISTLRDAPVSGHALPEGLAELRYIQRGIVDDKERLKRLIELMSLTLEELCRIGVAEAKSPGLFF